MPFAHFTPVSSLAGGVLIGAACALLWRFAGRIAGVSGMAAGLLPRRGEASDQRGFRALFLAGLLVGGALCAVFRPEAFVSTTGRGTLALVVAGLLVGVGTRLGNGCTSGHGVCGIGRLSRRSIVATLVFMATGALTVFSWGRIS